MTRQNLYTTISCSALIKPKQLQQFYMYLIGQPLLFPSDSERREFMSVKRPMTTVMNTLYQALLGNGKLDMIRPIIIGKGMTDVPEALRWSFMPYDALQAEEIVQTLKTQLMPFPNIRERMHLNITDIIKANGEFSDFTIFQSRCVRDFLVRSYYVSSRNSWLSYKLIQYICKVYNMTLGGWLAMLFNLDASRRGEVMTVFCAFYMALMVAPQGVPDIMKTNYRELSLPIPSDQDQIFGLIEDVLEKPIPETLEDVFAVCAKLNPSLVALNRDVLFSRAKSLTPENYVNLIAMEYPPLFTYFILKVLNGERVGLSFIMKNTNLLTPGKEFADRLSREVGMISIVK